MFIQFARFSPPRNPVVRLLLGLFGLVLLALFSVVGLAIAATVAVVFFARAMWRQWRFPEGVPQARQPGEPQSSHGASRVGDGDVIDGEFTVIDHNRRPNT